jgi:HEAT repeat protein
MATDAVFDHDRDASMSDVQRKQELAGLARSVDALFSSESPEDAEPVSTDVLDAPHGEPEAPSTEDVEPPAADPPGEALPTVLEAPPQDVGVTEPPPQEVGVHEPPRQDLEVPEPAATRAEPGVAYVAAEDFVPTELDRAVDAYLDGDAGRAAEIERIAAEMLRNKELEPIVRAVLRLAIAAGEPPDRSVHAVIGTVVSPVVLRRLARRLGEERDERRRAEHRRACRVLGEDMAGAIRDELAESTDRLARRILCDTLVEMGEPGRRVIEEMAQDENRFLARNAVAILGDVGGDRAAELVTSALANTDARVRREALRSLAKLHVEDSAPLVVGMLEDSDPSVRLAAAVAAGELRVERALRGLIGMLEATSDPDECVPLLRSLGQIGDPGAVSSIEKRAVRSLFSRPRADVRIAAYRALHQIGTPHARRLLNQAVSDKDPEVKAAVKELLHMR